MLAGAALTLIALAIIYYARRLILFGVSLVLGLVALWLSWRVINLLGLVDGPFDMHSVALGAVAAVGVMVLLYPWIYNALVEADRHRDLEKVNKQHDGRRI